MKRSILLSLLVIGAAAAIFATATIAPFSDSETSTGNTVTAGTLDLLVNGANDPLPVLCTVSNISSAGGTFYCAAVIKNVGTLSGTPDLHLVDDACSEPTADTEPEAADEPPDCHMESHATYFAAFDDNPGATCSLLSYSSLVISTPFDGPGGSLTSGDEDLACVRVDISALSNHDQGDSLVYDVEFSLHD